MDSLERLLTRYDTVHFRDHMAIQLTPTSGTMARPDRMGDTCPDLLEHGRIVQGHNVSGPLGPEMDRRIDRDLKDRDWREIFHFALQHDARFRRGFDEHGGSDSVFRPWMPERWKDWPISLAEVRQMSRLKLDPERAIAFDYGVMMVKTSASLWHTIQICQRHTLEAVTDSPFHDRLLRRIMTRDHITLPTFLLRE
jgi:hypothetical protein